ncbi:acyl-CoA thioesterase [Actinocorallia populi]|uniref:acyl-CoA thioesterase n=1 Tax=Actinocorallia populi TaxID=2079200 RepID=UPI0013009C7D|nr:acyl-CoA thioesterase domain-containing protein [Actinocorallia populi]
MDLTEALKELFTLERRAENRFTADPVAGVMPRSFGGQIAAQSLWAASLTVRRERPVHSLHGHFLQVGKSAEPLDLDVRWTREGRSFSGRHVTASQGGRTVFEMTASFQVPEDGEDWQPSGGPDVPAPEEITPFQPPPFFFKLAPYIDVRPMAPLVEEEDFPLRHPYWIRFSSPVQDPALHACLVTYLTDIGLVHASRPPGSAFAYSGFASLDLSVWFHRPARADEWLLHTMAPVSNHGARGMTQGSLRTRDGALVASIAQETLLRPDRTGGGLAF